MTTGKSIQIVLHEKLDERLRKHCDKVGFSISEYVRGAIEKRLTEDTLRSKEAGQP